MREGGQDPSSTTTRASRSVRSRVVAGLTVIVVGYSALMIYGIVLHRRTVAELALINDVYLPLTLGTSDIRATQLVFNTLMDRLSDDQNPSVTRDWIDAARRYRPVILRRLVRIVNDAIERGAPEDEAEFLEEVRNRLIDVHRRYRRNEASFVGLYAKMDTGQIDAASGEIESLKRSERLLDKVLAGIGDEVNQHITELADDAETDGLRATLGLVALTLLALVIGGGIVFSSSRLLAPLRRLQEAVAKVAGGDLDTHIEVSRSDEIGALAADFNRMTEALADRDEMIVRSERLAAAGKMAAKVTHEIRNPLSSLGLNAELLDEELRASPAGGEARALLAAMQSEIERLGEITESYLRFARLPSPEPDLEDLNETVAAAVDFMGEEIRGDGIEVETAFDEDLGPVLFDRGQIRQALINLLRNSCESMPDGGTVRVTTASRGDRVELIVEDTGCGIPEDARDRIFSAFFTTKSTGTGLGLALVRQICLAHGGEVRYEPGDGAGSRFVIEIPRGEFGGRAAGGGDEQ